MDDHQHRYPVRIEFESVKECERSIISERNHSSLFDRALC